MSIEQKTVKDGSKRYRANVYHKGERIKGNWNKSTSHAKYDEAILIKELVEGTFVHETTKTFGKIAEDYFTLTAPKHMNATNIYNEYCMYSKHIKPVFGHRKIAGIKPLEIQKVLTEKEKKYASSYVARTHMIMNKVFKQAKSWELIKKNPMERVGRPRIRHKKFQTWSKKEANDFLKFAKDYQSYIVFWIALNTGMRLSEILGLYWSDINFDENYINLTESLDRKTRKRGALKTDSSERFVYMSDEQLNVLKEHRITQSPKSKIVCVSSAGTYMEHRNIRRAMEIICQKSGVKKIRFHDLRHTHATLLSKIEKNPRIVQERLGHADVRMTLDVYTHTEDGAHKQSANSFSTFLTE